MSVQSVVTHRMPPAIHERLKEKARRTGRSVNEMYNTIMKLLVDGKLAFRKDGDWQEIAGVNRVEKSALID